jgi:hypothetical protein
MNDELARMWKETAMAYFKLSSRLSAGGTEENHKNPQADKSMSGEFRFGALKVNRPG